MMAHDQVDYVSGRSRLYGIVGHPIEQVRSPEMFTAEFAARGHHGIMLPFHVLPEDFDTVLPALMRMPNLDGLVFTIPFKQRAVELAREIGPNARMVGAINALTRDGAHSWKGEIFDGIGCVEGHRRAGISFAGKRVMLIGLGGAGSAIAAAIAHERPAMMRLFDLDQKRVEEMAERIRDLDASIEVIVGPPVTEGIDHMLNASPVGMLEDRRMPVEATTLPPAMTVFDAIVKPETTSLLALAETSGCKVVRGREMMRGQISRMADFFGVAPRSEPPDA
ncbi:MAG: shikimate dehydrogenase family protein [Bosea sp. (in: a-proteobacteria)]